LKDGILNNLLYWLNQTHLLNRRLVGDKALILSQLQQDGYGILCGFVLSSQAFREFMQEIAQSCSLLTDFPASSFHVNVDDYQTLQWVAQQSQQEILANSLPAAWGSSLATAIEQIDSQVLILRASLAVNEGVFAQFSGLLPAQICENNFQQLELSIKNLWANLFTAKSLFYCQRMSITLKQVNLAVLVQPLYEAIVSGIARFEGDNLHIQASWGLGHSLLKGEVNPDSYQVSLDTGQIKNQHLGQKMLAYCLSSKLNFIPLEPYLLNQDEQDNYCLNSESLSQLIQLLQNFHKKNQLSHIVEWTLTQIPHHSQPRFYLNQVDFYNHQFSAFALDNLSSFTNKFPVIIKGISASNGVVIAPAYVINSTHFLSESIAKDAVLVTKNIEPESLPLIKQIKGIITETGGLNSHAAIIARELNIPAIVGAKDATKLLKTGLLIRLDGNTGTIYLQEEQLPEIQENLEQISSLNYPLATQLMVNLSQVSSLKKITNLPIDGIGLLRSELMLLELLSHQSLQQLLNPEQKSYFLEQWSQLITQFAQEFSPRPTFYRSLDWLILPSDNSSASLKQRGTYRYCLDPTLFELELQALAQVYQTINPNLKLILPFVRTVEEFKFCSRRVEAIGLTQYPTFQLWIMAEVPSVIFLLSDYVAAGVQGIAIGSNDLTQLLLGVDRDQDILQANYNATHPAMLAALKQLITQAKNLNIPCSICGQAPTQYPELIDHLIRWGITSISVELDAFAPTYQAIARAEQRLLLENALSAKFSSP
jgi:pyruvate,water dikinase